MLKSGALKRQIVKGAEMFRARVAEICTTFFYTGFSLSCLVYALPWR